MYKCILPLLIVAELFMCGNNAAAQSKSLSGFVLDKQSDEPIPFASVVFFNSKRGVLTDSLGHFAFDFPGWPKGDTLRITSVGYHDVLIPFSAAKDSASITIYLEVLPPSQGATVKVKYNRALWFWRKIISHKPNNDKHRFDNYAYEVYNKLELDLNNVNKEKLEKNTLLKPLSFVLSYVDSNSEQSPYLPVYLTETLSDYYFQKQPRKTREVIKASQTNGIDNESIIRQLGATYQNVDIYNNTIPVFDKSYLSPIGDNADNYYNFKLQDTQYLGGKRLVHLAFTPKRIGENTFTGDCWVHDTSFSIQKITMRPSTDANINFISGLTLIQEFKNIYDTIWFLYKDKFVADVSPIGKTRLGVKARKTTTYMHVVINSAQTDSALAVNKSNEDILLLPDILNKPDSFWVDNRHEPLNKNEQTVYAVLDTLTKNKAYIHYRNGINFLTTGTKDIGNIRIGPWFYWVSGNVWEGSRFRFDLATNRKFNDRLYLHGYLAYGTKDRQFKGKAEVKYLFSREPWSYITASYKSDLDNGQVFYDQLGSDNLFSYLFRKSGVPFKFQRIEEKKLEYYQETHNGFGFGITASDKQYTALLNLPGKEFFPSQKGRPLNNFETALRIRFAYQEQRIEDNFVRTSFGSQYPIVELKIAHGWPDVMRSSYKYDRIDISISDYLKIAPYGTLYYNFFGGKVLGTLPYQFLEIQPGNEFSYYSRYSFNLMNRFEYITDRFAGFNIEHNIGSGLFRYIPFTRKLKLRQFWEVKGVTGNLSDANKSLNFVPDAPFKSLDNKLYMEVGTGVDNILKLFRVDFIWRLTPTPLPKEVQQRFGVFFGFRVSL